MSDRPSPEKVADAENVFLGFLLRSQKTGEVLGSSREGEACNTLVKEELHRTLDAQRWQPHPPRALRVERGYWIVYRRSLGGPALTIGTALDETVAKALINRIEAEGDTILTGKACPLCGVWVDIIDKDSRDATLKLLEIDAGLIAPSAALGCCLDCWGEAQDRVKDRLTARYEEWMAREGVLRKMRGAKFPRCRQLGRKLRQTFARL